MKFASSDFVPYNGFYGRTCARRTVLLLYKQTCQGCDAHLDEASDFHLGHIIPQSHAEEFTSRFPGLDVDNILNLHLLCSSCNLRQGSVFLDSEFRLNQLFAQSARAIANRLHKILDKPVKPKPATAEVVYERLGEAAKTLRTPVVLSTEALRSNLQPGCPYAVLTTGDLKHWLVEQCPDLMNEKWDRWPKLLWRSLAATGHGFAYVTAEKLDCSKETTWAKELSEQWTAFSHARGMAHPDDRKTMTPPFKEGVYVAREVLDQPEFAFFLQTRAESLIYDHVRDLRRRMKAVTTAPGSDTHCWLPYEPDISIFEHYDLVRKAIPGFANAKLRPVANLKYTDVALLQKINRSRPPPKNGSFDLVHRTKHRQLLALVGEMALHVHAHLGEQVLRVPGYNNSWDFDFPEFAGLHAMIEYRTKSPCRFVEHSESSRLGMPMGLG